MIVDQEISKVVSNAQKAGIIVFALTSGNTSSYGIIPNRADLRVKTIKNIRIDFSKSTELDYIDLSEERELMGKKDRNKPIFQDGVIFAAKKPKGKVLSKFLKLSKLKPRKIIFVDNQLKNVLSVEAHCKELGIDYTGIYFTKIYNKPPHPLDKKIAEKKRPILLSTGLATISDIDLAISILEQSACQNYALFQCTSLYPPKNEFVNLSTIKWLEERYKVPTGYSDHTLGIDVPVLSVAAGAVMIEKHFTLDKNRQGYDHGISLEPSEFKEMVSKIRLTEVLLGQAEKMLPNEVQEKREMFNRTIVATKKIDKGDILSEANIAVRRPIPGKRGLDPVHYDNIIGFRYTVDVNKDWPILAENVEGYE